MKAVPLLIRDTVLGRSEPPRTESVCDSAVAEDDLPAILDRDASGYVLPRDTLTTEVRQETHDDN